MKNNKDTRLARVEDAFQYISKQLESMNKKLDCITTTITEHSKFVAAQSVYNKVYWFLFITFFTALIGLLARVGWKI